MKKIVLVGKFSKNFSDLNKLLSAYFSIQLCSDNLELLSGIINMGRPDLIMIFANGFTKEQEAIFSYLEKKCTFIPVLCLGKTENFEIIDEFEGSGRINRIISPALISDIVEKINEILGCGSKKKDEEKTEPQVEENKKTILLVDDAAVQLRSMENILKDNYNVIMAESGEAAIEEIKKERPDLIFLDYEMPGCDGRETFELIKNEENGKDVPVVFVTGVHQKEKTMAVLKMKPAGYLVKPVKHEELLQMAKELLGKEAERE